MVSPATLLTPQPGDVYFSADVETDGPIPGPFSMLSFALVPAGTFDGEIFRRWWRIVLLNHESRLRKREHEMEGPDKPERLLAERRYRSHKMRLARCLTCFPR